MEARFYLLPFCFGIFPLCSSVAMNSLNDVHKLSESNIIYSENEMKILEPVK